MAEPNLKKPSLEERLLILEAIYARVDAAIDRHLAALAAAGRRPLCGKGCAACCGELFPVTHLEMAYLWRRFLSTRPDARRRWHVRAALNRGLRTLRARHPWVRSVLTRPPETLSAPERRRLARRCETVTDLWCPFLEEGACMVYPFRTYICRVHGYFYDPRLYDGTPAILIGCDRFRAVDDPENYLSPLLSHLAEIKALSADFDTLRLPIILRLEPLVRAGELEQGEPK